jgi:hypothetical protein
MKEKCMGNWPGMGLILAGAIVFLVGVIIILFKELNIPRYWIPAVVGVVAHSGRSHCIQNKEPVISRNLVVSLSDRGEDMSPEMKQKKEFSDLTIEFS